MVGIVVFSAARSYTSKNGDKTNQITNTITLNYVSNKNELLVYNTATYDDQNGILLDSENNVFDFSVTSNISSGTSCNYEIVVSKDGNNDEMTSDEASDPLSSAVKESGASVNVADIVEIIGDGGVGKRIRILLRLTIISFTKFREI